MSDVETPESNEIPENNDAEEAAAADAEASDAAAAEPEAADSDEFEFVAEPVIALEAKGDCLYEAKIEIPAENETKLTGDLLDDLQAEASLPGFRRGRAPRALIERKFGKALRADAMEKLVGAAFNKLLKENELRPIGPPDADGIKEAMERPAGTPIQFTLTFEVAPKCELGKYRGLDIERPGGDAQRKRRGRGHRERARAFVYL